MFRRPSFLFFVLQAFVTTISALPQQEPDRDPTATPFTVTSDFDRPSSKPDHPFPDSTIAHHSPIPTHISPFANPTVTPLSTQPPFLPSRHDKLSPAIVFFEIFGALFFLGFAVGIMRCLYSYKKTPHRDRIAGLLNRHWWHTQMEELAIEQASFPVRDSLPPPPPPYCSRPPSYNRAVAPPPPPPSPRPQPDG